MKKIIYSLAFLLVVGFFVSGQAFASPVNAKDGDLGFLTLEQIEEMNEALDRLKDEANERLEKGEVDFSVSTNVSFQEEPIVMEFEGEESDVSTYAAKQQKSFSHTVKNTAGFNYSHKLYGNFYYQNGKVTDYSYDTVLSGPLYGKTVSTKADRTDPSVVIVRSTGTFKALKYTPFEYTTKIDIGLYGSGHYRVLKASIS